jgi:IS1 family transposase
VLAEGRAFVLQGGGQIGLGCYLANAGGGALSSLDMKTIGELSATLFSDRQARGGLMTPWANGKNGKEYRATLRRKAIGGIFSVGVEEPYRWKDSVQSEAEIRIWVAEGTANGLRPWFTKFSGTLYDRRWLKVVEDIYHWHFRAEKYLRNEAPLARVGMVYSQKTATFYGGARAQQKVEDHTNGFYHALIEARTPFEMGHDGLLDAAQTDQFKLLINDRGTDAACGRLLKKLVGCQISRYYTDDWQSYKKLLPAHKHQIGEAGTRNIERHNLNFRTHVKRLQRRTICYSKSVEMHDAVLKLYVQHANAGHHHL